jgi:hypothetical protein
LWVEFLAVFPLASKLGLFAIQYLTMRVVITQRRRRAEAVPALASTSAA